ncbi:MAG: hypothetical protein ABI682_02800 [Acidobacteriota bacterium]
MRFWTDERPLRAAGHGDRREAQRSLGIRLIGVGGSARSGRIYLAAGTLVVAFFAFRIVRGVAAAASTWQSAASAGTRATAPMAFARSGWFLAGAAAAGLLIIAVAAGAVRRRPWARPAAMALLGLIGASALGVALFQADALVRGTALPPEVAEVGYDRLLAMWRVGGGAAAFVVALFCAAALRRLTSREMRREFSENDARPTTPL